MQSPDYAAYNKNLRNKVPTDVLIDKISELNDNFAIQNNGLGFVLRDRFRAFNQRNAYNEELNTKYKGPKEEPIPPKLDLIDPYCRGFVTADVLMKGFSRGAIATG